LEDFFVYWVFKTSFLSIFINLTSDSKQIEMSKVVLITGGSSGIGKAIGEYLHHKGFAVYGTSRNPDKVVHSIFPLIALDVRDVKSIHLAVAKIIQETGAMQVTRQCAVDEAQRAIADIAWLPDTEYKKALIELAYFSLGRRS
jgi:NAD(P)-dependent dehydrogenase (short-subunit alcohol dehydrogenase family)